MPVKQISVGNMPYHACTSSEKAKARRLEAKGLVKLTRELDSRVLRIRRRPTLVTREIFYVEPIQAGD